MSRAFEAEQTSRAQAAAEPLEVEADATRAGSATQVTPSAADVASTTCASRPEVAASIAAAAVAAPSTPSVPSVLPSASSVAVGSTAGPVIGTATDRFTGVTISDEPETPAAPTGYQSRKDRTTASLDAVVGVVPAPSVMVTARGRGPQTAVRPMLSASAVTVARHVAPGARTSASPVLARTEPTASLGSAWDHVSTSVRVEGRTRLRDREACGSVTAFLVPLWTSTTTVTSSPGRATWGLMLTRVALTVCFAVAVGVAVAATADAAVVVAGAVVVAAAEVAASPVPASTAASSTVRAARADGAVSAALPRRAARRLMRPTRGAS